MDDFKIYRIRDRVTGLWSRGGGSASFGKKAKTWDQLGHVQSHITNAMRYNAEAYKNSDIMEYTLTPTVGRVMPVQDIIDRKKREKVLYAKYGRALSDMVAKLEKEEKIDQFPYALIVRQADHDHAATQWIETFADLGIRRASYRKSYGIVTFATKEDAMKARLACNMQLQSLNLVSLVEDN